MEPSILLVFVIIACTVILFITEYFPVDKIGFLIIIALVLLQLTTPEEAISGFSNPAVITILSLMIIATGLEDNGVIDWLTQLIKKLKILPLVLLTPVFMLVSAGISSFISTTAVVIIFLKIISQLAERYNFSASKLLMPISFAGILGGSCTLMGTSTNLIVNSVAQKAGVETFSFFEFSTYGLVFLAIGIVFMTIASKFLPKDKQDDLQNTYDIESYIFSVTVSETSDLIGKNISEIEFISEELATPLKLIRNKKVINAPGKYIDIKVNDNLVLMSSFEYINRIIQNHDLIINDKKRELKNAEVDENLSSTISNMTYVELLILPGSGFIGKTLKNIRKMSLGGAYPIAIKKRKKLRNTTERLIRKSIKDITLKPGDRLLIELQEQQIGKLRALDNVVILNQHEYRQHITTKRKITALVILLMVVGLAASGVLSILSASLAGVAAMLLFRLISLENIYHRVNWQIIFLLAGMIPLGIAMTNSGADLWLSNQLQAILTGQPPYIVIGLLLAISMILSGFISNNATAIILTPVAIGLAAGLNLDVKPFILAVLFGANFSFFTPVGYQTNTLIYGTGLYKFKHFLIIGGLLSLILWVAGTIILTRSLLVS
ncbi:SLC13 family permease [Algibacter amylolyticus]|uniref:SLC13 family permease n=1 Tax=Algibacter amylolyticus TaxID=1608400 RepID=A0A5M7B0N1_9FLAO|nr:SLC13 family permease [Algibacter amylolyticus]KAA5821838.1 SLC13 family permease [Algibacter amylolyticus]MBB5269365.1 di/tricarboxylate transporter [Algibacter amylolyticus]TSJ73122.1 SLC13 family permease [Algibacter amylolyticus]